jgi:hypothetical protein
MTSIRVVHLCDGIGVLVRRNQLPVMTTPPDSLRVHPALPPQRSWLTVCPPAVVVDEASDVAFPGGISPAVKA